MTTSTTLAGLVARVEQTKSKEAYHRAGVALLKSVAREIGHPTARVYSSRGGPAVLGEIGIQCLGVGFWGQICQDPTRVMFHDRIPLAFLYRKASAADPYGSRSGNMWAPLAKLTEPDFLAYLARGLAGGEK